MTIAGAMPSCPMGSSDRLESPCLSPASACLDVPSDHPAPWKIDILRYFFPLYCFVHLPGEIWPSQGPRAPHPYLPAAWSRDPAKPSLPWTGPTPLCFTQHTPRPVSLSEWEAPSCPSQSWEP